MLEASLPLPFVVDARREATAINDSSTVVANRELLCCDLSEGAVILDLKTGVYYSLDTLGTYIWRLIQEPKVISDIVALVLEEYAVERGRCMEDIKTLFAEMSDRDLIEIRK
jgi:Coenzyme PQQ synthesis protein D (PqqD)